MTSEAAKQTPPDHDALPWWCWTYRLLRIAVMLTLAYWLSRSGDAFFYQGF